MKSTTHTSSSGESCSRTMVSASSSSGMRSEMRENPAWFACDCKTRARASVRLPRVAATHRSTQRRDSAQ